MLFMDYLKDSFSVNVGGSEKYRENWNSIFGGEKFRITVEFPDGDVCYVRSDSQGIRLVNKSNSTYFQKQELDSMMEKVQSSNPDCHISIELVEKR